MIKKIINKKSTLTGIQAYHQMKIWLTAKKTNVAGLCQKIVHEAWHLPAGEPSALSAWNSVPLKHRHTDPNFAPVGAPHFWLDNKYGHVALQSEIKGKIITIDLPKRNFIGEVPFNTVSKKWGMTYLGWASNYMGHDLKLKDMPK